LEQFPEPVAPTEELTHPIEEPSAPIEEPESIAPVVAAVIITELEPATIAVEETKIEPDEAIQASVECT